MVDKFYNEIKTAMINFEKKLETLNHMINELLLITKKQKNILKMLLKDSK